MKKQLLLGAFLAGSIITANAQTISFETSEGYTLGELDTQNYWTLYDAAATPNVLVTAELASKGTNSLAFTSTNEQPDSAETAIQPVTITATDFEISQDIYTDAIDATNGSGLYVDTYGLVDDTFYSTSEVIFSYKGNILIMSGYDETEEQFTYTTASAFKAATWYNVKVRFHLTGDETGTATYYINGTQVYTGPLVNAYTVDAIGYSFENWKTSYNVDNIVTNTTLGTKEALATNFSIYPNPANSVINIANASNMLINAVTLTDVNGRKVKSAQFDGVAQAQVNISDLATGVYMMTVSSDKGSITKKIVKN